MGYIQLSIQATVEDQELLIAKLSVLDCTGFEQTDTHLLAYFNEENFASYDVQASLSDHPFTIQILEEQNWNVVWESNFDPVVVGKFCGVRAHFHMPMKDVQYEIVITPKMSFGTGHHATTHMMIEGMQYLGFKAKKVLDFGTGTGILAILAEKLGASHIDAIDNDAWSISNAVENVHTNHCLHVMVTLTSQPAVDNEYDIILANINMNVILEHMHELKQCLTANGKVLISGLLAADEHDVVAAAAKTGLLFVSRREENKWISMLFVNGM